MITNYAKQDLTMLLNLSYELLKIEFEQNDAMLINHLLRGQVKPDILFQLIRSNHYDQKAKMVVPKPDKFFNMSVGAECNLLQYTNSKFNGSQIEICKNLKDKYLDKFQFQLTKKNGFAIKTDYGYLSLGSKVT